MDEILLISSDLQARVRLESAAGREVIVRRPSDPLGAIAPGMAVLDLDQMTAAETARWVDEVRSKDPDARVIGFFSHVQRDIGRAAEEAGVETYRRGNFWSSASDLLGPSTEQRTQGPSGSEGS